ncbi:MAG: hypothetical protein EZS28_047735, partial [Streblomastix strix]
MNGLPTLLPAGNTHNLIHPLPVYVREILASIVVVSPLAQSISVANPPVLINFVAVMFPSYVNYYGWTWSFLLQKSLIPLAAAVAFTNGTFAVVGSTFNGCQYLAQVVATPASPFAVSYAGKTVETYKGCQWSPLAYSLLVPALPFTIEFDGIASLAGVTQSGTTSPLLYHSVSYIHTVPLSALKAKSPLAELGKFYMTLFNKQYPRKSGELFGFVAVLMDYF